MPITRRPARIILPTGPTRARWVAGYTGALVALHDRTTLHAWWTANGLGTRTEGHRATAAALAADVARWDAKTLADDARLLASLAEVTATADESEARVRATPVRTWWAGEVVTAEGACPLSQLLHADHCWAPADAECRYCALPNPDRLCSGCLEFYGSHAAAPCEPAAA